MLVSAKHNFIFIHVAKTGGKAIKQALRPYAIEKATGQWRRLLSHLPVHEHLDARFGPHASARWAKIKLDRAFFQGAYKFALVRNPFDLAVSRYAFIRGNTGHHRHRDTRGQSFAEFLKAEKRRAAWRPRDQSSMICDWHGNIIVDKVYRFEQIEEAYIDIVKSLDLQDTPELVPKNASVRSPYQEYYSNVERKLVEDIWARDLNNFKYAF